MKGCFLILGWLIFCSSCKRDPCNNIKRAKMTLEAPQNVYYPMQKFTAIRNSTDTITFNQSGITPYTYQFSVCDFDCLMSGACYREYEATVFDIAYVSNNSLHQIKVRRNFYTTDDFQPYFDNEYNYNVDGMDYTLPGTPIFPSSLYRRKEDSIMLKNGSYLPVFRMEFFEYKNSVYIYHGLLFADSLSRIVRSIRPQYNDTLDFVY